MKITHVPLNMCSRVGEECELDTTQHGPHCDTLFIEIVQNKTEDHHFSQRIFLNRIWVFAFGGEVNFLLRFHPPKIIVFGTEVGGHLRFWMLGFDSDSRSLPRLT